MPIETLTFLPWGFWLILLGIPHKIWCHWNQVTLMSKINILVKTLDSMCTVAHHLIPGLKTHNGDGHRKKKVAKKQWVEFKGYIQASSQMYTFISFQGIASEQLWACLIFNNHWHSRNLRLQIHITCFHNMNFTYSKLSKLYYSYSSEWDGIQSQDSEPKSTTLC
jgi:hypothetical protein